MFKSLIRTIRGPSRDARMRYISRPLPRGLLDQQVLDALEIALAENPDPAYLSETLGPALRRVTGHEYEILDRSVRDVTGNFGKTMVMIRDGEIGIWPGHAARAYPLLAEPTSGGADAAIVTEECSEDEAPPPTSPVGKPGWAPPPVGRRTVPSEDVPEDVPADDASASAAASAETEAGDREREA